MKMMVMMAKQKSIHVFVTPIQIMCEDSGEKTRNVWARASALTEMILINNLSD